MVPKLVRDKIPDLAASSGDTLYTTQLTMDEFKEALRRKLIEEANEAAQATDINLAEELADCEEIIRTIADVYNISLEEIENKRIHKLQTNGGFTNHLLLVGKNGKMYD